MMSVEELNSDFVAYNQTQEPADREICDLLLSEITRTMTQATSKIWHGSPVWFLDGNPIVGYHKLKGCIRLLFWSGQSFDETRIAPGGTFKAAEKRYRSVDEVDRARTARLAGEIAARFSGITRTFASAKAIWNCSTIRRP